MKKHRLSYERKRSLVGYAFLIPWFLGFFGLFLRTLISAFRYSLSTILITNDGLNLTFIGFDNYVKAFVTDTKFLPYLTSQLKDMLINVPVILAFSLFIALILNQEFKGRTLARSVFFLPVIIGSGVIITIINGDSMSDAILSGTRTSGLFEGSSLSDLLLENGFSTELVDGLMGFVNDIFELSWKAGLQILLFIAALQTVPHQLYEVARVEGANAWETFFKVTLPLITPIAIVNIIYTVIDSFTDYGNELLQYINDFGLHLDFAYSSALGYIYFAVIFLILGIIMLLFGRKINYTVK